MRDASAGGTALAEHARQKFELRDCVTVLFRSKRGLATVLSARAALSVGSRAHHGQVLHEETGCGKA